jgi:very-short-patch-repair endonuclease
VRTDPRERLVRLLNYIEQVIRLDEKVVLQLSDYRLPDGTAFAFTGAEHRDLPGVRLGARDDEGPVWLEVARLARQEPPSPPAEIADWLLSSSDPASPPRSRSRRLVTTDAAGRDLAVANGEARPEDVAETSSKTDGPTDAPPSFELTLRLDQRPEIAAKIAEWIAGPWSKWATDEQRRRGTIAIYQQLYKLFQLIEVGGYESPIELIWGIGLVHWQKDGRVVDRPLLEIRADLELDDASGGLIRIRPTGGEPTFDLKPFEELGCEGEGLGELLHLIRRELKKSCEANGLSPFARDSFEPILAAAASRLGGGGRYLRNTNEANVEIDPKQLTITDQWVLFARPRSQHVVLQDIGRLRSVLEDGDRPISGLAERLVTEPSKIAPVGAWTPPDRIGATTGIASLTQDEAPFDVFFPKPYNDDQIELVRRLKQTDGFVVQGPPGTGKTHTIANLICHAMATGERVLVVSRGEAALAVLKEQLPKDVQPLAIAVLSNERQGLRQLERAIREIEGVVEGTSPEKRGSAIRRLEAEIDGLRKRIAAIDQELDAIAAPHFSKIGPRGETAVELAHRVVAERDTFAWFTDRPPNFAAEAALSDQDIAALADARRRAGEFLDHLYVDLPTAANLASVDVVRRWHEDLVRASQLRENEADQPESAAAQPVPRLRIPSDEVDRASSLAEALHNFAATHPTSLGAAWIEPLRRAAVKGDSPPSLTMLRERIAEWVSLDADRPALARRSVELPPGLLENGEAREAINRAAAGERLWPIFSTGKAPAKTLVAGIRLDRVSVRDDDINAWRHVAAVVAHAARRHEIAARWDSFAAEFGAPPSTKLNNAVDVAREVIHAADDVFASKELLATIVAGALSTDALSDNPDLCHALAKQIGSAAGVMRLRAAREQIQKVIDRFLRGSDRTSALIKQFLEQFVGNPDVAGERIESTWRSALQRLTAIKSRAGTYSTILKLTELMARAGAPAWAERARTEPSLDTDPVLRDDWREAWDHAAANVKLASIAAREALTALVREREEADARCRNLFTDLVRERIFFELDRRLSPAVKSALVEFVRALAKIGKGTGKTAATHRSVAREAMARCYDAIPCWIMPTWRVAEQLPAELGVFDLVIIDEASQSDVTELPALLRGRKLLVVGDDRQVSPTAPFVTQERIAQLRQHYLDDLPFKNLLEPGESIYDLMRAVFPSDRLMLKEHFRCVEPIIRFSTQFYPERLVPLRIPTAQERLEPPLIDIYVPHGRRDKHRKINPAEAQVIVGEINTLTQEAAHPRSIGVISLIGSEQAEYIRALLSDMVGEEVMQRHAILCGDSATFQGTERDVVFLSMVADPANRTALTTLRYEQRFNVAVSRARDRVVLVRSLRQEDLNPNDLKARLIAHFSDPMRLDTDVTRQGLEACETGFERDVMRRLLQGGYRVQPQVGPFGFRIDLVVEGGDGRRLAIECDGDRFHGPEQWREDMRRQRVLERAGWQFWRCFASSFYRDMDTVTAELFATLSLLGIEPAPPAELAGVTARLTEHRIAAVELTAADGDGALLQGDALQVADSPDGVNGIAVGDKIVLLFADDQRRLSIQLTNGPDDLGNGVVSTASALGIAVSGAEEGEEIEFEQGDGQRRRAVIEIVVPASSGAPVAQGAAASNR